MCALIVVCLVVKTFFGGDVCWFFMGRIFVRGVWFGSWIIISCEGPVFWGGVSVVYMSVSISCAAALQRIGVSFSGLIVTIFMFSSSPPYFLYV